MLLRHSKVYDKFETAWFEDKSESRVESPPPSLIDHPELQDGDVFVHRWTGANQAWMWDAGKRTWISITAGHRRADGRCFSWTKVRSDPSWVGDGWAHRRLRED